MRYKTIRYVIMMAVEWRMHVTGSGGCVAMERKMARVVVGVRGMD
jgi:hypothetical protein